MSSPIEAQIRQKLQQIYPVTLQKLAEDLACVKFPDRFGRRVLRRLGRNDEDQTTKGWPDAFVSTGPNEVDGIEATRQAQTWKSHLEADLTHAADPRYRNLSGYVFVGGYPGDAPTEAQIDNWVDQFVAVGLDRAKVTILVGADLVVELCKPEYAAIRQLHLGIAAAPDWFRLLGRVPINDRRLGLFQPTQEEYDTGLVRAPTITDAVIEDLLTGRCTLVRGYGAAGKTTLAELVARHERIAPNSVWYADLAQATEETAGAAPLNEMTELAARGTLFVVDNVHLNPDYAGRLQDHWTRHLAPLGARLLLLGRRTHRSATRATSAIPCHELRAGVAEMLAVAGRLAAREGRALPSVSPQTANAWARTFGGSDRPDQTAVDLIAFTAAVDRRLQQISAGDFRLSAADAVDAVRTRYLQPLQGSSELPNILRLAALAEFEIPLMDEQLPDPIANLRESVNSLGLVVHDELGLEARRHYRLVHAGVGPLLLEAASGSFSVRDERLAAVAQSPALGWRISAALRRAEPHGEAYREFGQAVRNALSSPAWPNLARNLYELGRLARHAAHLALPEVTDASIIASNAIPRLLSRAPAIPALNQFLAHASRVPLPRAAAALGAAVARPPLLDVLGASWASEVAALIRAAPNGPEILTRIDAQSWSDGQARSPPEPVSRTVSACRFFDSSNRPELARAPSLRQVALSDPKLWDYYDLSYLSHIIRFAQPDTKETQRLLSALTSSAWLSSTVTHGILGHLCGALLSLGNYLDPVLRRFILIPALESRLIEELSAHPTAQRKKTVRRPICLLGGYYALGGQLSSAPQLDWSADPKAELVLNEVAHSEATDAIGTYELQLWLGFMALHQLGQGPAAIPAARGESMLARLDAAMPPTTAASVIQKNLLSWLKQLREVGWRLD